MRRITAIFISLLTVSMLFGSVGFVFAEDSEASCDCWCKTSAGATQLSESNLEDTASCRTACSDAGSNYMACYTTGSTPADNDKCWSQYECENNLTEIDGEEVPYEWDQGQPADCIPGEHYCYRPPEAVDLSIVIGSAEEVDSIPDYINVVYNFLLPTASLLVVLVIMVGGLQWMLARGDSGRIGRAKERVKNAVTGLVLLLSAVAMGQMVDPNLTNLNRLTPPAIRTVVFIDPESTCEAMEVAGLTITPEISGQEDCGNKGTVDDVGDTEATIQVGDECFYSGCDTAYEVCAASAESENGFACLRCKEVFSGLASVSGATPSSSMCGYLVDKDEQDVLDAAAASSITGEKLYCLYYDAPVLDTSFDACSELVYPADGDTLDCDTLRQDALADESMGCRAYDLVESVYEAGDTVFEYEYEYQYDNEVDDRTGADDDFPLLSALCDSDPCGLAPAGGEGCKVFTNATSVDDISQEALDNMSALEIAEMEVALAGDVVLDWLGALQADSFANCANSTSAFGWFYCKDVEGNEVDCNPTW
ncbi:hypothetical protein HON52_03465 [Candidatus Uhrbacteria bacterium]|jgi:hypothetical protein|nr:hypothetical protein [Candidatus Uhrbacteria bacterium]